MANEKKPVETRDKALEADILKEAGTAAQPNQQAIKEQAQNIASQAQQEAPKDATVQGTTGTTAGQSQAVQPDYGKPAPTNTEGATGTARSNAESAMKTLGIEQEDLNDYLQWKKQQAYLEKSTEEKTTSFENPDAVIKNINAEKLHEERTRLYGEGYVVAKRKNVEQVFTATAWRLLGGKNNQEEYTVVVATPPEIANMRKPA